ncbi:hypothetical protein AVEN_81628-1 [Araneus ventricosus]|uniref:Uncharacterized protein n=1 Tax=Araneus ventricosus TaxID=182803 RepID=A0A4Y2HF34_ARAVE|nr:hypothetical protein AVEN_81628-1 [Araneus ventricosus]
MSRILARKYIFVGSASFLRSEDMKEAIEYKLVVLFSSCPRSCEYLHEKRFECSLIAATKVVSVFLCALVLPYLITVNARPMSGDMFGGMGGGGGKHGGGQYGIEALLAAGILAELLSKGHGGGCGHHHHR